MKLPPHKIPLPAATPEHATRLAKKLTAQEIDGVTVEGTTVSVPWGGGSPAFAWGIGDLAADHCHDHELSRAITTALAEAGIS